MISRLRAVVNNDPRCLVVQVLKRQLLHKLFCQTRCPMKYQHLLQNKNTHTNLTNKLTLIDLLALCSVYRGNSLSFVLEFHFPHTVTVSTLGKGTLQSFIRGGSAPRSTPYSFVYHIDRKATPFTGIISYELIVKNGNILILSFSCSLPIKPCSFMSCMLYSCCKTSTRIYLLL